MFNFCPFKQNDREGLTYNSACGRKTNSVLKLWKKILMDYPLPQLPQSANSSLCVPPVIQPFFSREWW